MPSLEQMSISLPGLPPTPLLSKQETSTKRPSSWVVVFAGARDSYQVPIALQEAGLLEKFVTDFYSPLDKPFALTAFALLPGSMQSKLRRRFHPALSSDLVEWNLKYALRNLRHPEDWPRQVHLPGRRAGRIAMERGSALLAYAHVATSAFARAPESAKALFQMQPHPRTVREILTRDTLLPEFRDGSCNELNWAPSVFETYAREPLLADLCIVNSSYTRRTLIENGVKADGIRMVPYGVDCDFFAPKHVPSGDTFRVLFVGQLVRQKGLHYLLEAWRRLELPNADLRIAGRLTRNHRIINELAPTAQFLGPLSRELLREEYRRADLLCLPSLSDGFGLVVLEAMACGTPALVTTNCGAADLIEENQNGFVIPSANLEALVCRLEWASRNRDALRQMRGKARAIAERYPWSVFRKELVQTLHPVGIPA
jgi:glycosyltransferase involved in cell wall biosynthesis